jgi:hypothetical protein
MPPATAPQQDYWIETSASPSQNVTFFIFVDAPNRPEGPVQSSGSQALKVRNIHRFRTLRILRHMFRYQAGWDGEDAAKPNRAAINQAIDFLDRLVPNVAFKVAADPNGAILLELDDPARDVILAFEGSPEIVIHRRTHDRFEHTVIRWDQRSRVPRELAAALGS